MAINDLDNANIQIYGDDLDIVAVAPFGTTLPVGLADLTAPFKDLGWLSEDGIDWDDAYESSDFKGHQGGKTVLKLPTNVNRTFKVQCLEETAITLGLRYPGFTPAKIGSEEVYGGELPGPKLDPRVFVVDLKSITSGKRKRYAVPKGTVTEVGTLQHRRSGITMYELTVEVLEGKAFLYSDAPGWAPA
jgi:hypothetical protein